MVTRIESFTPGTPTWTEEGRIMPGHQASISNTTIDNEREIFVFRCASDNSSTKVFKATLDSDTTPEQIKEVATSEYLTNEAEIKKDGRPYVLTLKTDESPKRKLMRFRHE